MSKIQFEAKLSKPDPSEKVGSGVLLVLPKSASEQLPSRGMTLVEGTINGSAFKAVLEPNGKGSHWFRVDKTLRETARADVGDTVKLEIEPSKDWPEPKVPADLKKVLSADPEAQATWEDITPMARWDWIRWTTSAKLPETRQRRIESIRSRFKAGKRRPCCFDRTQCTLTDA